MGRFRSLSASGASERSSPPQPHAILRRGFVNVKEEGLRSWIWSKRWLVLREQHLSIHKNDASFAILL